MTTKVLLFSIQVVAAVSSLLLNVVGTKNSEENMKKEISKQLDERLGEELTETEDEGD